MRRQRLGRNLVKKLPAFGTACLSTLLLAIVCGVAAGAVWARPAKQQVAPPAQPPAAPPASSPSPTGAPAKQPDWMVAAGGHMEFDVISVKQNTQEMSADTVHSNIPLGPMDLFTPTGGLLSAANYPFLQYIVFAYKLTSTQVQSIQTQLPKWANTDRYDIEAKASGNPTKDQYRLMMQALLADRFNLALHYESKDISVLALVMDKPGKMGPHIRIHPDDAACSTATPAGGPTATVDGGYPEVCGVLTILPSSTPGRIKAGGRNVPMSMLANMFGSQPVININKPVVDKTGIDGKIDFTMEFSPEVPPGAGFTPDPNGPTFLEALKDDMGIKLETTNSPVDSIVIDHVEEPSEN